MTWTSTSLAPEQELYSIAWSGSQFVAVGRDANANSGLILTSPEGTNWTVQNNHPLVNGALRGIAWSGSQFVAVSADENVFGAAILTSSDGINWTQQIFGDSWRLYGIAWSGSQFVAVGWEWGVWNTLILTSPDGINWTQQTGQYGGLYGITWSGSQFVAVGFYGDGGYLILTSPDGITWTRQTSGLPGGGSSVTAIAWGSGQFVTVGYPNNESSNILTSPDGINWTSRTYSGWNNEVGYSVIWSGSQFVVVGSGGVILTSPDGINWTRQDSGFYWQLRDIAWSGSRFVAVGAYGDGVSTSACPWGDNSPLNPSFWGLVGLPAQPTTSTIAGVFGDDDLGAYNTVWRVYQRNDVTYVDTFMADINSPLVQGVGYWIKHKNAAIKNLGIANAQAAATPLVTTNPRCPSTVGCYEITLKAFSDRVRYNQISFPLPYPVAWWDVRVEVDNVAYVPSAAQTYVNNQYWVWKNTANTNNYATFDDITPGKIGVLQPWQGIQVEVKPASFGKTVKLLIPALPKTSQALPPTDPVASRDRSPSPSLWGRLLDGLIAPAAAAELEEESAQILGRRGREAIGERERESRREAHGRDFQAGRAWSVRLRVEEASPDPSLDPSGAELVFGQLADAQVGYDRYDLLDLPPEQGPPDLATDDPTPSLSVVFPHPDWGARAGDYASDYRPTNRGAPASSWRFEIRTDTPGGVVQLHWDGPAAVLKRSVLLDEDLGTRYAASDAQYAKDGIPVVMHKSVRHFTWRYSGKPNGLPGKD